MLQCQAEFSFTGFQFYVLGWTFIWYGPFGVPISTYPEMTNFIFNTDQKTKKTNEFYFKGI